MEGCLLMGKHAPPATTTKVDTTNSDSTAKKDLEKLLDLFNNTLGFGNGKSNCAGGGSCADALNMAVGAVIAGVASGGADEEGVVARQIEQSAKKLDNLAGELSEDTLTAAKREVNGGMKVAKAGGGEYDHVGKVENAARGLNRQLKHLQKLVKGSGLSETHVQTINGLIERGRGMLQKAVSAITKDPA